MTEPLQRIESPCIGTCSIGADGLCTGCFRSRAEIATWSQWAPAERTVLMKEALPERECITHALQHSLHRVGRPPSDGALNWADIGPLFELQNEPDAQFRWREAAVLIGLVARHDGIQVLLTQRTETMRQHSGQVSFPGGARDDTDVSIVDTALREVHEEIGIPSSLINVVGFLDRFATISHYLVTPVVAWVDAGYSHELNPVEVSAVFELPLNYLMDDGNLFHSSHQFNGHVREVPEYRPYGTLPYRVWGATAAMIQQLKSAIVTGGRT